MNNEKSKWHDLAASLQHCGAALIDGKHVSAQSGETFPAINPATGQVLTDVASMGSVDVELAVASAIE